MRPEHRRGFEGRHGLNRHSTDLDCDAEQPVERRDRIDSAAQAIG